MYESWARTGDAEDVRNRERCANRVNYYASIDDVDGMERERGREMTQLWETSYYGYTPLHVAAKHNSLKAIEELINFYRLKPSVLAQRGVTTLHVVAQEGNKEAVELLIRLGAEVNKEDFHARTPLNVASGDEVIKLLKDEGAVMGSWEAPREGVNDCPLL